MKINWGLGIAMFYASFMFVLILAVVKSTTFDNSLVADNYYERDINYQKHYDKIVNNDRLDVPIDLAYDQPSQTLNFSFPKTLEKVSGTIQLFNPVTEHLDLFKKIQLDNNASMHIKTHQLKKGRWKIKVDWKDQHKSYFQEMEIVL